jgi:hypothetical protein
MGANAPQITIKRDGAFYRVLVQPPIPEGHPQRRPQTFGSLKSAEHEAALLAKLVGGTILNAGGYA